MRCQMKTTLILMVAILIAGVSDAQERGGRTRRAEETQNVIAMHLSNPNMMVRIYHL